MSITWPWRRARKLVDPDAPITREVALQILMEAGWFPGRLVDVSAWITRLERDGHSVFPAGLDFLRQFGRIDVRKYSLGVLFVFDPTDLIGMRELLAEFESEGLGPLCPVGIEINSEIGLAVDEAGDLIAFCEDGYGRVAYRFGEGLDGVINMIMGSKEIVRIDPGEDEYVHRFTGEAKG